MVSTPRGLVRVGVLALGIVATAAMEARAEFFVCKPPMSLNFFIEKALTNADTEDVILVHSGTIDETVVIDYGNSNQSKLVITKTDERPVITQGVIIKDTRSLVFDGFKVLSTPNDGVPAIVMSDSIAPRIVNCRTAWLDDGGIDVVNCFEVVIDKCRFAGMGTWEPNQTGFGVRIVGRCGHLVRDTRVEGNTFRGIWIEAASSEVVDCKASKNGSGGASAGIYVRGMRNIIRGCEVSSNDGFGVFAIGGADILKNEIVDNDKAGIRYGDDGLGLFQGGEIFKNQVRDNGGEGISIKGVQEGCLVRKNDVRGNQSIGIRVSGRDTLLDDNDVRDTKGSLGHAILVESDGNLLRSNRFDGNQGAGVFVVGGDNYLFENQSKTKDAFVDSSKQGNAGRGNETKGKNDFP